MHDKALAGWRDCDDTLSMRQKHDPPDEMETIDPKTSEAAALLGALGGRAGRGISKRRSAETYRRINAARARNRWADRKKKGGADADAAPAPKEKTYHDRKPKFTRSGTARVIRWLA